MASRITKSTLYSAPFENIKDVIDNRTNVADPTMGTGQKRKFVYSRTPDTKASDFVGYPFIVINPVKGSESESGRSLDMKSKILLWSCEIEVYASDRGYGGKDGQGNAQCNTISDAIWATLNDKTIRKSLQANGLYKIRVEDSTPDTFPVTEELVHYRSFTVTFENKVRVSD